MSSPINTCVLGVGLAGLAFHVPFVLALPDLFILHSVLERNPTSPHGKVHDRFGVSPRIHTSIDQVCDDPEIELVIVGTPNETHYAYAKAALLAGKHVLVDKPIAPTAEEAKELREIARSKNLVLYPYQNRRWDSDFLALRRLLALPPSDPRSLGDLHEFESHFDRYRAELKGTWKDEPKPAAGQLFDLGSHLIDQALALFGRPKSVTAFAENIRGVGSPDVDDSFTVFLRYPAGAVSRHPFTAILRGHILSVRASQLRFSVRGTKGTYIKYGVDVQEDQLRAMPGVDSIYKGDYGVEPETLWGTIDNLQEDGSVKTTAWPSIEAGVYANLFRNLAAVIRDGAEQAIKWEESTTVVEIIQLAHQSSKEGRTIDLPAL
ncbi:NAD-P-binding protein [Amylostereum chailletii]|nr:NAD-P-binding protein [Amylostereum chailletii]